MHRNWQKYKFIEDGVYTTELYQAFIICFWIGTFTNIKLYFQFQLVNIFHVLLVFFLNFWVSLLPQGSNTTITNSTTTFFRYVKIIDTNLNSLGSKNRLKCVALATYMWKVQQSHNLQVQSHLPFGSSTAFKEPQWSKYHASLSVITP